MGGAEEAYTVRIFGELELFLLQISVEERTENGREHRSLGNAYGLTVISTTNLDDILCDVLF